jgi:predicted RNA-binding protein with PIN domain
MKQLILDGYNVINKIPELRRALDKNLQAAREALMDYMISRGARWNSEYTVTVVFDARKVMVDLMPVQVRRGITIMFAEPPHDADEMIIEKLRQAKHASAITVVSDDNKIANHVRAFKGKLLKVREFVNWMDKRSSTPVTRKSLKKSDYQVPANKIDSVTGGDITEELKKIWK